MKALDGHGTAKYVTAIAIILISAIILTVIFCFRLDLFNDINFFKHLSK